MHKAILICTVSVAGAGVASYFGGWDAGLQILLIFMGIDFVMGLGLALMKKSTKSESGGLNSQSAWRGLLRKFATLSVVVGAAQLDRLTGTSFIRDAAVISYITGEAISVTENAALMGAPIPSVILKAIDVLQKKSEGGEDK